MKNKKAMKLLIAFLKALGLLMGLVALLYAIVYTIKMVALDPLLVIDVIGVTAFLGIFTSIFYQSSNNKNIQ